MERQEIVQPNGRKSTVIISHLNIPRPFLLQCVREASGYAVKPLISSESMSMKSLSLWIVHCYKGFIFYFFFWKEK